MRLNMVPGQRLGINKVLNNMCFSITPRYVLGKSSFLGSERKVNIILNKIIFKVNTTQGT